MMEDYFDVKIDVSGSTSEFSSIDPKLIIYPNYVGGSDVSFIFRISQLHKMKN